MVDDLWTMPRSRSRKQQDCSLGGAARPRSSEPTPDLRRARSARRRRRHLPSQCVLSDNYPEDVGKEAARYNPPKDKASG